MIGKRLFIEAIENLRIHNDLEIKKARVLSDVLGSEIDPSDFSLLTNTIFSLLGQKESDIEIITHFCFEQDFGRATGRNAEWLWQNIVKNIEVTYQYLEIEK